MKDNTVKIYNPNGEGWLGTQYEINGKRIENVKAVDFRAAVDEVPQFTFETLGLPDIEMDGDIRFSFTPKTVKEAAMVICKEFHPQSDYFKAMVASVEERLRMYLSQYKEIAQQYLPDRKEIVSQTIAEDIARQILGI